MAAILFYRSEGYNTVQFQQCKWPKVFEGYVFTIQPIRTSMPSGDHILCQIGTDCEYS